MNRQEMAARGSRVRVSVVGRRTRFEIELGRLSADQRLEAQRSLENVALLLWLRFGSMGKR